MLSLIYINLLFLPSLIEGLVQKVNLQLVDTLTSNVIISSSKGISNISDANNYLTKIRSNNDVSAATSTFKVGTQISSGNTSNVWSVDAIDPNSYKDVFSTPNNIIEGSYLNKNDTDSILLGVEISGSGKTDLQGYALSLKNVHAGDTVSVNLVNGKTKNFKVKGIFENDFLQSDQKAYVTQNEADKLFPASHDQASAIYVKTKSGASDATVGSDLASLRSDIKYQTSDDLAGTIKDQVKTFDLINQILKVISLIVAAITVFIVTYVDLINKRKQIGIERAIGIQSGAIVGNYLLKSLFFALVGIGVGVLVFLYIAVPFVTKHPFQFPYGLVTLFINPSEMVQNGIILGIVAFLSSLIPAFQSIRIKILDAIWGL
jgi:putative ABC transport system permease protein